MKKDWEYKKLGEVCKTYAGGTPLKTCKEYYDGGTIPWLRSGEVCRKYIDSTELFITQKGMDNSSAKYYPVNTIVVAMYGATAAQVGILKIESTSNQAVCGILPNDRFVPEFLFYWFTYIKDFLASQAQGGAQPNISQVKIKNLTTPIPPLSEQKDIVEYLDSSFAKIDKLKENAAKNLEEAKALFQSALKDALEPKEGWEEKTMDEIVDINTPISYGIVQPGDDVPDGIPVVRPVDLIAKNISLNDNIKRTAKENSESYKRTILNGKEILMCVRGTTGIVSLTDETLKNCNVTRGIVPLKITDETLRLFVYYTIIAPVASEYIQHNTKGAALKQINIADVKKIPVALPSPQEQQSIVSFLDSLNEKLNTLQQNYSRICDECDALKQAILRQVFE